MAQLDRRTTFATTHIRSSNGVYGKRAYYTNGYTAFEARTRYGPRLVDRII